MFTKCSANMVAMSLALSACAFAQGGEKKPQYPAYPSEMPDHLQPVTVGFDYERRDVMVPMRDGVKMHVVILVPNGAKGAPILLTRTP